MLARTPACVECGLPWGAPGFKREDDAPLYWSDTGLLCSSSCAQVHFAKRRVEGTFMAVPAECPVEV